MCRDNENVTPSWRSGFTSAVDSSSGLVVRIPGSHPGGPGSIPGVGTNFCCHSLVALVKMKLKLSSF